MTNKTLYILSMGWDHLSKTDRETLDEIADRCQSKVFKALKGNHSAMLAFLEGAEAAAPITKDKGEQA